MRDDASGTRGIHRHQGRHDIGSRVIADTRAKTPSGLGLDRDALSFWPTGQRRATGPGPDREGIWGGRRTRAAMTL